MNVVTLLTGRGLVESPRWHRGRLYFSDWSAGEVLALTPREPAGDDAARDDTARDDTAVDAGALDGDVEVIARVNSLPLCTAWLPDGRLVIVDSATGTLLRRESDGS